MELEVGKQHQEALKEFALLCLLGTNSLLTHHQHLYVHPYRSIQTPNYLVIHSCIHYSHVYPPIHHPPPHESKHHPLTHLPNPHTHLLCVCLSTLTPSIRWSILHPYPSVSFRLSAKQRCVPVSVILLSWFFFFISTTNYATLHSYRVAHRIPQAGLDLLPQLPPLATSVTYDLSNMPKLRCSRGLLH